MKTLQAQLVEMHEQIRKLGGTIPTARGCLERQLNECDSEIKRLKTSGKTLSESNKTRPEGLYEVFGLTPEQAKIAALRDGQKSKSQELYEALGLTPEQAKLAARLERGVERKDINTVFECGLLMGMTEAQAQIFANPQSARGDDMLWSEQVRK